MYLCPNSPDTNLTILLVFKGSPCVELLKKKVRQGCAEYKEVSGKVKSTQLISHFTILVHYHTTMGERTVNYLLGTYSGRSILHNIDFVLSIYKSQN